MRAGNRYQFFQPVGVGEQIRIERKVTDLKEKDGKSGALLFLAYDLKYTNKKGELLGINNETLVFRIEKEKKEKPDIAEKKIFVDAIEGQEILPLRVKISKTQMMMYAAATWNPYQLHWDSDYAQKNGFRDANVAGPMFGDYLAEMIKIWANKSIQLKSLEYTNRAMAFPGDTIVCKGKLQRKIQEERSHFLECKVWVENQEERILVEGKAILVAP